MSDPERSAKKLKMAPITIRLLVCISAFLVMWTTARAVVSVLKSSSSDNIKASWIAFAFCAPLIGPIVYWLFSHSASEKEELEAREVTLKARFNSK
ncbi:MAG: PLDc N-terminal domain-containing protein [Rariglobus sp.]